MKAAGFDRVDIAVTADRKNLDYATRSIRDPSFILTAFMTTARTAALGQTSSSESSS
jgi:hypothetical protein